MVPQELNIDKQTNTNKSNQIEEKNNYLYQLFLKTIIITLIFYIFTSPIVKNYLKKIKIIQKLGINLFLNLFFGFTFFILHLIYI